MRGPVRNWPTLTQCLAGMLLAAGCHGMEPLQVDVQDPLRRNDRDVVLAGRGCTSDSDCGGESLAAGRGSRSSTIGTAGSSAVTPTPSRPSAAGSSAPSAGSGARPTSSGAAGRGTMPTRPSRTPNGGTSSVCGDGVVEAPEACEKTDLLGFSCVSFGYPSGLLKCDPFTCEFDLSSCRRAGEGAAGDGTLPLDAGVAADGGVASDASVPDASVGPDEDAGVDLGP